VSSDGIATLDWRTAFVSGVTVCGVTMFFAADIVSLITVAQSGDTVEGSLGARRGGSVILQNGTKTLLKAFKEGHVVETSRI
jgi:hypothetical protein